MADQVTLAPVKLDAADVQTAIGVLKDRFPDWVKDDTRQGYGGVIVDRNHLIEVATTIQPGTWLRLSFQCDGSGLSRH